MIKIEVKINWNDVLSESYFVLLNWQYMFMQFHWFNILIYKLLLLKFLLYVTSLIHVYYYTNSYALYKFTNRLFNW